MIPKYFLIVTYDNAKPSSFTTVVARNQANAVKKVKGYLTEQPTAMACLEDSWLAQVGVLLLPRYEHRSKRQWEWIKL